MPRQLNPFTDRQIRLIETIREKIYQIDNPDSNSITNQSYEFITVNTKQFGRIPKIRFTPNSCQIKSELLKKAGLMDEFRQKEIDQIRQKYGFRKARNSFARLFESEWNNTMLKAKKATFTLALINQLMATGQQPISEPIHLLQSIVMDEYKGQIKTIEKSQTINSKENKEIKGYADELAALEWPFQIT